MRLVLQQLVLPPGGFLLLGLAGLLLVPWRRRAGLAVVGASLVLLLAASTRVVSSLLLASLQTEPAWTPAAGAQGAEAIVVLGGDLEVYAVEYGGPTLGALSLERARYAALVQRETGLPILTSGGNLNLASRSLAELLAEVLRSELGAEVRWLEPDSANTHENARRSAAILARAGVERVLLVTHAWHMPRARAAFLRAGLEVVPAPTIFDLGPRWQLAEFLPSGAAVQETSWAAHEWAGRLYYALRH